MSSRVTSSLRSEATPQQQKPPMARSPNAAARGTRTEAAGRPGRVYKLENGKAVPVNVRVGLSDGKSTEVIEGLAEGDKVIVGGGGDSSAAPRAQGPQRRGPF